MCWFFFKHWMADGNIYILCTFLLKSINTLRLAKFPDWSDKLLTFLEFQIWTKTTDLGFLTGYKLHFHLSEYGLGSRSSMAYPDFANIFLQFSPIEPTIVQPAIYQLFGANWLDDDANSISWFPYPFPNASSEPLHSSCPIKLLMCQRGPNSGSLQLDRVGTPLQRKPSHALRILGR